MKWDKSISGKWKLLYLSALLFLHFPSPKVYGSSLHSSSSLFILLTYASAAIVNVFSISELKSSIATAAPGTTIIVQNGVYTTNSSIEIRCAGSLENPIVIQAETIGGVEIQGSHGFSFESRRCLRHRSRVQFNSFRNYQDGPGRAQLSADAQCDSTCDPSLSPMAPLTLPSSVTTWRSTITNCVINPRWVR